MLLTWEYGPLYFSFNVCKVDESWNIAIWPDRLWVKTLPVEVFGGFLRRRNPGYIVFLSGSPKNGYFMWFNTCLDHSFFICPNLKCYFFHVQIPHCGMIFSPNKKVFFPCSLHQFAEHSGVPRACEIFPTRKLPRNLHRTWVGDQGHCWWCGFPVLKLAVGSWVQHWSHGMY